SLFLLLGVSVISSKPCAVNNDSNKPTTDKAREYGKIIFNVSRLNGISGKKNVGKVFGIVPKSPIVCNFTPLTKAMLVITMIAINGAGLIVHNVESGKLIIKSLLQIHTSSHFRQLNMAFVS